MIEKAFVKRSNKTYWAWIIFLLAIIAVGCGAYAYQMMEGFHVTGMSRGNYRPTILLSQCKRIWSYYCYW